MSVQKKGKLRIKLQKISGEEIKLAIIDNGSGLPDNFQLEEDASMGLTIAKKLVENQLGGSFEISSGPDGRTSSYIVFPLDDSEAE